MKLKRRDVAFPRLDLPKHRLTGLQCTTELKVDEESPIPDDEFGAFLDLSVLFMSASGYTKSGLTHIVTVQLLEIGEDEVIGFDLSYLTDPTHEITKPPGPLNREADLLRWLEQDTTPHLFECAASFAFEVTPGKPILPWFPLPHRPPAPDDGTSPPLTEIRGIHAVKLTNDDVDHPNAVDYTITLDRLDGRHVSLTVDFSLTLPCTSQLPDTVMTRAREIADGLHLSS